MLRIALAVISAVSGGIAIGRTVLADQVSKRKHAAIEAAAVEARARIRDHAEVFLAASMKQFVVATLVKMVLLLSLWGAHRFDLLSDRIFLSGIVGLLTAFMVRDTLVTLPTARIALRELRTHGWHPKRAVSEVVAAHVFEQVLEEAAQQEDTRVTKVVMRLAGAKKDKLSQEVAEAVADVARQNTWRDLRPFALAWAVKFSLLSALYGGFVFILLRLG